MICFLRPEHICRHHLGLINGVGHAFQTNALALVGKTRAIACGPNFGLRCLTQRIGFNPVIQRQPSRIGQLGIGLDANANEGKVNIEGRAVAQDRGGDMVCAG